MTRSEVVGWCHVMSCTCRGPWGHTEVQGIQEELSCSLVGADWMEMFWTVTGGEMMLGLEL